MRHDSKRETGVPRARPFSALGGALDEERRMEKLERAVDEIVGLFVVLTNARTDGTAAQARRLAAAGRRLWRVANTVASSRRSGSS